MDKSHLPEIVLTATDLSRLDLLTGYVTAYRTPVKETLARELRRARIVAAHDLPKSTVTMHSTLRYRDEETGAIRTATLVYPGEEDRAEGKMSVLTPIGCALIGLSAGQCISYEDADGRIKAVAVVEVLAHPNPQSPSMHGPIADPRRSVGSKRA
jgi:regulator of nucleoside diphosphate kinase